MKRFGLAILAVVLAHAVTVHAEQWTKTYTISNTPDLRVETSDANIHVDTWDQKTIEATITSSHFKFGSGGLTVEERQSGDTVEINLRFPHEFHIGGFTSHRVDIAIHMPRQGRVRSPLEELCGGGRIRRMLKLHRGVTEFDLADSGCLLVANRRDPGRSGSPLTQVD